MDAITPQLIAIGCLNLMMFPLVVFLIERFVGRKMDSFDEKRELARAARDSEYKENRIWRESMTAGMRSLLRAELISEHRKWSHKGYCPLEAKQYLTRCHSAYRGVGGNDIGDALYEACMKLPNETEGE